MAILIVDDLRLHVESALGDVALQRLLDAAEEAIVARAGASGARTEIVGGGYRFIALAREADTITSITERVGLTDTVLAADDYLVRPSGTVIERLNDGTNERSTWGDRVTIVYTPVDDTSLRETVQIDLVQLALDYSPGVAEERIGDWTQAFSFNSAWTPEAERDAILSRLDVPGGMVVVGNRG